MRRKSTRRKTKDDDAAALAKAAVAVAVKAHSEVEAVDLETLQAGVRTRQNSNRSRRSCVTFVEDGVEKLQLAPPSTTQIEN